MKEAIEYVERIAHLSRIELDLDDGVKVNYENSKQAQSTGNTKYWRRYKRRLKKNNL